jgi:hypothetical protein
VSRVHVWRPALPLPNDARGRRVRDACSGGSHARLGGPPNQPLNSRQTRIPSHRNGGHSSRTPDSAGVGALGGTPTTARSTGVGYGKGLDMDPTSGRSSRPGSRLPAVGPPVRRTWDMRGRLWVIGRGSFWTVDQEHGSTGVSRTFAGPRTPQAERGAESPAPHLALPHATTAAGMTAGPTGRPRPGGPVGQVMSGPASGTHLGGRQP